MSDPDPYVAGMPATTPDHGEQTEVDPIMARIGQAIALSQQGQRADARSAYSEIWAEIGADGEPLHRCLLAHHMADVQDDPRNELAWDLRALEAAKSVTDQRAAAAGATGPVAAFYPSLHLNLGEDHRKLGDMAEARRHLELGRRGVGSLGDDPYSSMIKAGLEALAERLTA